MKVAIFQPTYLPWLGFFKAIDWADRFVFLDDVQFEKHSWQSRNRIKSPQGDLVLTVPTVRNFPQNINEVKINYAQDWVKKHLDSMQSCYNKVPFFTEFFPVLEDIYQRVPKKIMDLNVIIIRQICEWLKIDTEFSFSSDLSTADLHKNEKLIAILEKLGADQYIYAQGAKEYMEEARDQYSSKNIKLIPLCFEHPIYPQLHGNFMSHLSIIDAFFNCGKMNTRIMLKNIDLLPN